MSRMPSSACLLRNTLNHSFYTSHVQEKRFRELFRFREDIRLQSTNCAFPRSQRHRGYYAKFCLAEYSLKVSERPSKFAVDVLVSIVVCDYADTQFRKKVK